MSGPRQCLVHPNSARAFLLPDKAGCHAPLDRTHSDLVKFAVLDPDYEAVRNVLSDMNQKFQGSNADTLHITNTKTC